MCDVFVGNVAPSTTETALLGALRAACPAAAAPTGLLLPRHARNGRRRPFAFAQFADTAGRAVALAALVASPPIVVAGRELHFRASTTGRRDGNARGHLSAASRGARFLCPKCGTSIRVCRERHHLLVCPARHDGTQRWFKKDVNLKSGNDGKQEDDGERQRQQQQAPQQTTRFFLTPEELENVRMALQRAERNINVVASSSDARFVDVNRNAAKDDDVDEGLPPLEVLQAASLAEFVHTAPRGKRNPESAKHRTQQASIVAHLEQLGALAMPGPSAVLEFGAGSGFLSSALRTGYPTETDHTKFFLVDRETPPLRRGDKRIAARPARAAGIRAGKGTDTAAAAAVSAASRSQ